MNLHHQAAEAALSSMRKSLALALFYERIRDLQRADICVQAAAAQLERAINLGVQA